MSVQGNEIEQRLVIKAKHGDVSAFSKLYSQIYKDLYRFALYMMKHPQDAEDAVSEAVVAAYENIEYLKKEESFKSWMFTIVSRECKRILRKRKTDLDYMTDEEMAQIFEKEPDRAEQYDVRKAFEALEEEDRTIIAFSVFGGYKSEEIATMMGKNPATVRSRKCRALEKMKVMLD